MEKISINDKKSIMIDKNLLQLMKENKADPKVVAALLKQQNKYMKLVKHTSPTADKQKNETKKEDTKEDKQKNETKAPEPSKSTKSKKTKNVYTRIKELHNTPTKANAENFGKIKVGITVAFFDRLYTNGHKLNTILWYDFLSLCGFDVYFVIRDKYESRPDDGFKYIEFNNDNLAGLAKLDVVFIVGTLDQSVYEYCRKNKKRTIYTIMGSTYHNDVKFMLEKESKRQSANFKMDEIWLSPHFEFCREYYKVKYKTDNVFVGPYFWREDLFRKHNILKKVNKHFLKLRVAIVEPNIELAKNCVIPIAICEKAKDYIEHTYVFNSYHMRENLCFKSYVFNKKIHFEKKLSIEGRYPLGFILSNHANCVVSCVRDCELNYVFLECFYLGIPLIHNSKMLKNYGYYYPDYDVSKAAEQIKNVLASHNRKEYIERHKPLLQKYSVYNTMYHTWVQGRISKTILHDCFD